MLLADFVTVAGAAEAFVPATAVPAEIGIARPVEERIHVAQKKRRTLMDLLFGDEPAQEERVVEEPVKRARKEATLPEVVKPTVEKASGATRLAVFGNSMAVDLAKALERFYAEDPNIVIVPQGVGSSGFVRQDFFDWNKTIGEQIAANSFDIAVVIIGINDRQAIGKMKALTPEWSAEYTARVTNFVNQLRNAGKPTDLDRAAADGGADLRQGDRRIREIQKLAAFSGGAEFLDIYERFLNEEGKYSRLRPRPQRQPRAHAQGRRHPFQRRRRRQARVLPEPDAEALLPRRRRQSGIEVADALAGTDAQLMVRPPYQGLGQIRLLEVAGAVISLTHAQRRAVDLVTAETARHRAGGAST